MKELNEKIRKHLNKLCVNKGWLENDEEAFSEIVRYGKIVFTEVGESHRWYSEEWNVVDVDGMLIGFGDFYITGDNSASDMGLEFDWGSVCEVEAVEVMKTIYKPKGDA